MDRPFENLTDKQLRAKKREMAAVDPLGPALEAEVELRRRVSGYFWGLIAAAVSVLVSGIAAIVNVIRYFQD